MLRIIYMGTPQFAVPALEALIEGAGTGAGKLLSEGYELVTVITRPDKPVGRGREIAFSPIKQCALAHHIPVWQPGSFKQAEHSAALAAYHADLYIVAAFGQILPQAVLDQPRYGTLNIHASLLPKYRGADPIAAAILQGETETGVTIMLLDAGIDTGPMLFKQRIPLTAEETTETLTPKLATLGAQAICTVLPRWLTGQITPEQQDERLATHTRMLKKEDGRLHWERSAAFLARQIRAYTPWPGTYTHWRGKLLKILAGHALPTQTTPETAVGYVSILHAAGQRVLSITTGEGLLAVTQLQLEGKKATGAEEFLRGYGQINGEQLS